ncbi:unnamed protein product, partial [Owenia fusiformis]
QIAIMEEDANRFEKIQVQGKDYTFQQGSIAHTKLTLGKLVSSEMFENKREIKEDVSVENDSRSLNSTGETVEPKEIVQLVQNPMVRIPSIQNPIVQTPF